MKRKGFFPLTALEVLPISFGSVYRGESAWRRRLAPFVVRCKRRNPQTTSKDRATVFKPSLVCMPLRTGLECMLVCVCVWRGEAWRSTSNAIPHGLCIFFILYFFINFPLWNSILHLACNLLIRRAWLINDSQVVSGLRLPRIKIINSTSCFLM